MTIKLLSKIPDNSKLLEIDWSKKGNTIKGNELDNLHWGTINENVVITFADGQSYSIPRYYLYQIYNDNKLKDELYDEFKINHYYNYGLDHKTVIENKVR